MRHHPQRKRGSHLNLEETTAKKLELAIQILLAVTMTDYTEIIQDYTEIIHDYTDTTLVHSATTGAAQ